MKKYIMFYFFTFISCYQKELILAGKDKKNEYTSSYKKRSTLEKNHIIKKTESHVNKVQSNNNDLVESYIEESKDIEVDLNTYNRLHNEVHNVENDNIWYICANITTKKCKNLFLFKIEEKTFDPLKNSLFFNGYKIIRNNEKICIILDGKKNLIDENYLLEIDPDYIKGNFNKNIKRGKLIGNLGRGISEIKYGFTSCEGGSYKVPCLNLIHKSKKVKSISINKIKIFKEREKLYKRFRESNKRLYADIQEKKRLSKSKIEKIEHDIEGEGEPKSELNLCENVYTNSMDKMLEIELFEKPNEGINMFQDNNLYNGYDIDRDNQIFYSDEE